MTIYRAGFHETASYAYVDISIWICFLRNKVGRLEKGQFFFAVECPFVWTVHCTDYLESSPFFRHPLFFAWLRLLARVCIIQCFFTLFSLLRRRPLDWVLALATIREIFANEHNNQFHFNLTKPGFFAKASSAVQPSQMRNPALPPSKRDQAAKSPKLWHPKSPKNHAISSKHIKHIPP